MQDQSVTKQKGFGLLKYRKNMRDCLMQNQVSTLAMISFDCVIYIYICISIGARIKD